MSLIITVKVVPNSGKVAWLLDKAGVLKCYLKSSPEQGKANKELIKNLAQALNIAQNLVSILTGQTSRTKRIKIESALGYEDFLKKIGIEPAILMQKSFL